jgi:type I restriction enzyme S subunit
MSDYNGQNGWPLVALDDLCERKIAMRDPRARPDEPFVYVDISSVDNKRKQIVNAQRLLGRDASSRARQVILERDVLVATTRPNLNAVAIVPQEFHDQIASTGFCVLRPSDKLDPEYLFSFVQSWDFVRRLSDLVKGALYPAVTERQVRAQKIPLLPLDEQRRIAARLRERLSIVAEACAALKAQLAAAESLLAAHLHAVFETTESEGWAQKTIGEMIHEGALTEHQDGNHGELHPRNKDFVIEGVKFVTAKHINSDGTVLLKSAPCISAEQASLLRIGFAQANDVLLAHNATVGKVGIAPPDCDSFVVGTSLTIYRANEAMLNSRFIFYALRSAPFQRQLFDAMKQTTRNQVPITKQRTLSLPVPSPDVQHEISAELTDAFTASGILQDSLRAKLSELEKLPAALLHSAFNPNGD